MPAANHQYRPALLACSVLLCLLATACAPTSTTYTRYLDSAAATSSAVLLAARMPDINQRRIWEQACVETLGTDGLRIATSHTLMPGWYEGDNDALLAKARRSGLDAILVAELSGLLLAPMQLPPRNQVSEERFTGPFESQPPRWQIQFGSDDQPPPPEQRLATLRLIAANGETRWEGELATHEANDLEAIARSQCRALGKELRRLNLLP